MKNFIKVFLCILIILIPCVCMAQNIPAVYTYGDNERKETKINTQIIAGENVIVMPSSSKKVTLFADFPENSDVYIKNGSVKFVPGTEFNAEDKNLIFDFTDKNGIIPDFCVKIFFSENLPAVYLVSDNPAEKGREWVESSADKKNKATGFIIMQKPDGETVYSGSLTQIKGRGNSTWSQIKKPYQIKLSEKADLLETGKSENKSKTWVLLANYLDPSLLHNSVVLEIGKNAGMKTNVENTYVDLYYDGEYRGCYLLSEKVEIGSGRVNVSDLEGQNSEINADREDYPVKVSMTENGAEYTYCEGMISPEDVTGGYLLEMDYEVRAKEEICYFRTTRNQYVVVKSPELASKEEMEYIASLYQEYEDAVFNGGINPSTGKAYSDYVDRESTAVYYLLGEFSKARDFFGSSAYLSKNRGEEKMYMGPLWDYDLGFTQARFDSDGEETPYGLSIYNTEFGRKLSEIHDFASLLESMYKEKILPMINEGISGGFKEKSDKIKVSAMLNSMLWHNGENTEERCQKLISFIKKRAYYLENAFDGFSETDRTNQIFIDVLPEMWYSDFVRIVNENGYMNGVNELCFDPYSPVRRSEAAQVIFNMSGKEKVSFKNTFSDINEQDWYSDAVEWCAENKILAAVSEEKFMPARYTTREEIICALYSYKNCPETEENLVENFVDADKVFPSVKNAFNWAIKEGLLLGDDNGCLNPADNLTRAELAAILARLK